MLAHWIKLDKMVDLVVLVFNERSRLFVKKPILKCPDLALESPIKSSDVLNCRNLINNSRLPKTRLEPPNNNWREEIDQSK